MGRCDGDALRDSVREYALEMLADLDAVLVPDEAAAKALIIEAVERLRWRFCLRAGIPAC